MSVISRIAASLGVYGPSSKTMVDGNFTTSGGTGGVTAQDGAGFSVARTGVGTFVITYARVSKVPRKVTLGVQASTTAQAFIITANDTASTTITQVTAGSGTAVDTLAATVHFHAIERYTS